MDLRQFLGFVLGGFGVWMMWHAGVGMEQYIVSADGVKSVHDALFEPKYALRLLAALAAFVGGLAALTEKNGGSWLTGLSAFIFGLSVFGLIASRSIVADWASEAISLSVLTGLFLAVVVARGRTAATTAKSAPSGETASHSGDKA
ncbi:MAG: hypothetical protein R3C13_04225 [Hyphomonas sp.]|uniref:hypothetical protein n=1 Tax=Hyphomonas sp. TaxID=87 RepID=UPI003526F901